MRELNDTELHAVSGAGLFSDAGKALGAGIGAIIDAAIGKGSTAATDAAASLGNGIGLVIDSGLGFLSNILGGWLGIRR